MKHHTVLHLLSLAAAAILLSACATTGAPPSQAGVAAYRDVIELGGKLSVSYSRDGQPETLSGAFNWVQRGEAVDVTLSSPLGQTIAELKVTPDAATLKQGERAPRVARDIDTLTAQALGWSLPVSGLRDWLQGYATAPGGKRFAASPAGNTVTTADGWELTFVSWEEGAGAPRPKRIDARRAATLASGELSLRIVIYERG